MSLPGSPRSDAELPPAAEDPLADDMADPEEEEEEGEDLFGENMMADYAPRPELDNYDPEILDDGEHEPMTVSQRLAAERELARRDVGQGRRALSALDPPTPGGASSDAEGSSALGQTPDTRHDRKRRRLARSEASQTPLREEERDTQDEDDVPEGEYDLSKEKEEYEDAKFPSTRLAEKIRKCFQQFLLKFKSEGQSEARYPDLLMKMAENYEMHLDVNFAHVQQWSAPLALWIADVPHKVLPLLNETLMSEASRKFRTYQRIRESMEEESLPVAIHSFPVREAIQELGVRHLNKLISVHGVVTKRSQTHNQLKRLYLRCAKCGFLSGPFEVEEGKELKPGSCVECQSKGPWQVDRQKTVYRNFQKITLQESPSAVEPGKMPRSKEVILTGDQVDSVRPGDELQLTGVYACLYDALMNARTCFPVFKTEIQAVHVKRRGDVKGEHITDEEQQRILALAQSANIRERIIASMAPSIYGMTHVKTAVALSMFGGQRKEAAGKHRIRGDINTLIVGDPGLAKSQFLKYVENIFPRAVYTTGKGASAVGLTAAVTRDEHGQWVLEGGAMVLADSGICLIDEFDKMNDQDRTSIHEAMEQQTISISKAGIVATLQARCAVIAVGNPIEGRYNPTQPFARNVNLSDPILSRFDIICVLRDEADDIKDAALADHVVCSHIRSHPDATAEDKAIKPRVQMQTSHVQPLDQDLLQKYIIYARQKVFPKWGDTDREKLSRFYAEMRKASFDQGGAPMTVRHVDGMMRISEANARMELRQHVTSKDVDNAIAIMLESFIQSQKHNVAEELRTRFRSFISSSTPQADLFVALLENLFQDRADRLRESRPQGDVPEISEVTVGMDDVLREVNRRDVDWEQMRNFILTERFRERFHLDGNDQLRRLV